MMVVSAVRTGYKSASLSSIYSKHLKEIPMNLFRKLLPLLQLATSTPVRTERRGQSFLRRECQQSDKRCTKRALDHKQSLFPN